MNLPLYYTTFNDPAGVRRSRLHGRCRSKYQIVIPAEVRRLLGIKKGQRLQVLVDEGTIRLVPTIRLTEMRGYLRGMDTQVEGLPSVLFVSKGAS